MEGSVVLTERAGHGRGLARDAIEKGCRLVIAWGGDGTVNEVAGEVVGTEASLGIVRAGSGNGLARELGIAKRPDVALAAALTGREHAIDTGEMDGRLFLNIAGIGFDATMALQFNELGTERRGPLRYSVTVVRNVFAYRAARYRIELDGEQVEIRAILLAIANLPQYGSNAVIAPQAVPFDGLLDLVVIGDRGPLARVGAGSSPVRPIDCEGRGRCLPDGAPPGRVVRRADGVPRGRRGAPRRPPARGCNQAAIASRPRCRPDALARIFRFTSRYTRYMTMNTEARGGAPAGADAASGAGPLDFIRQIVADDLATGKHSTVRHPVPARAQRLPAHRAREIDLPELRCRPGVRRHLQPALRRHEPDQGRRRVRRLDHRQRSLARASTGRIGSTTRPITSSRSTTTRSASSRRARPTWTS